MYVSIQNKQLARARDLYRPSPLGCHTPVDVSTGLSRLSWDDEGLSEKGIGHVHVEGRVRGSYEQSWQIPDPEFIR